MSQVRSKIIKIIEVGASASGQMHYDEADLIARLQQISPLLEWDIDQALVCGSLTTAAGTLTARTALDRSRDPLPLHLEAQRIQRIISNLLGQLAAGCDLMPAASDIDRLLNALRKRSSHINWSVNDDKICGALTVEGEIFTAHTELAPHLAMPLPLAVQRIQLIIGPRLMNLVA